MSNFNFYAQQPTYIPPQQSFVAGQPRASGRWVVAKNYSEVISTPIPADGSQTIFLMESEPRFYTAYMESGQKYVQGFDFTPVIGEAQNDEPIDNTEKRLENLESSLGKLISFIEGSVKNEPNTHANGKQTTVPTKTK